MRNREFVIAAVYLVAACLLSIVVDAARRLWVLVVAALFAVSLAGCAAAPDDDTPIAPLAFVVSFWLLLLAFRSVHMSGICDGYCYAREPNNRNYWYAGEVVHDRLKHRYRDLRDE